MMVATHYGDRLSESDCFSRFQRAILISLIVLVVFVGCKTKTAGEAVHGKISYRGQPLPQAAITFFPEVGRPSTSAISDQGEYSANLAPGNYTVVVNIGFTPPPGFKEGDPMPKPKVVLPDQYTIRAKSVLKATVAAGQDAPIDFDLK